MLFIFLGLYSFSGAYRLLLNDADTHKAMVREAIDETVKDLELMKSQENLDKLTEQKNLDAFLKEYDLLEAKLLQFRQEYAGTISLTNQRIVLIGLVTALLCFFSGAGLIFRYMWARMVTFISCSFFCLYYVFIWIAIYPSFYMMQYIMDKGNTLSLLIDPQATGFLDYAGKSPLNQILFGFPFIVFHLFALSVLGGTVFILTRPNIKQLFQK